MSDSKERLDYAGLSHFKDQLLDDIYAHVYKKNEFLDNVYPVGSIYISVNEVSPENLFGGEWEQIKDTFLLAAGDTYESGETGGEAVHTLSVSEMPSHSHTINGHTHSIPSLSGTATSAGSHSHSVSSHTHTIPSLSGTATSAGSHTHSLNYSYFAISIASSNTIPVVETDGDRSTAGPVSSSGSHSHAVTTTASTSGGTSLSTSSTGAHSHSVTTNTGTTGSTTATMTTTGSGDAHNNMPPYLTVYMWQRIA